MKLASISIGVALVLAGCAQSAKDPGKGTPAAKSSATSGKSGGKADTAAQVTSKGFALVEGDDTTVNVTTVADDVAQIAQAPDTPAKGDWCKDQDWQSFRKQPPISRWKVTVLDGENNPVVGATLSVRKQEMGGKKGYVAVDTAERANQTSNVFTIYIAAGRHYELYVSSPDGSVSKQLNFDTRRPVDVAFPMTIDSNGGQVITLPGQPPQQQQIPGQTTGGTTGIAQEPQPQGTTGSAYQPPQAQGLPAPQGVPPPQQQKPDTGVWPWCFDDRPAVAPDDPNAAAAQLAYMKGKMAKLETVVRCRLGDEWDRVVGAVNDWSKGKPWHWHHFACDQWPALGVWAEQDGTGARVKLAFSDLSAVVSMDPNNPKACDGSLKAEIGGPVDFTKPAAQATGNGSGLYGCNRGTLDTMDLLAQVKKAGLAEAVAAMQAHIGKNEDVTACTVEGSGLNATAVISFGADVIKAKLANFSPDFLD